METLKCQVCKSLHPRGFPKVCLELDHFLEEQFPKEYALRKDVIQLREVRVKNQTTRMAYYPVPLPLAKLTAQLVL